MIDVLRRLVRDDSATAIVEYALILALISMVSYATLIAVGDALSNFFIASSNGLGQVAQDPK